MKININFKLPKVNLIPFRLIVDYVIWAFDFLLCRMAKFP